MSVYGLIPFLVIHDLGADRGCGGTSFPTNPFQGLATVVGSGEGLFGNGIPGNGMFS